MMCPLADHFSHLLTRIFLKMNNYRYPHEMNGPDAKGIALFHRPPSFSEWITLLSNSEKKKTPTSWKISLSVMGCCFLVILVLLLAHEMNWWSRELLSNASLICLLIMWITWIVVTLWDVWKLIRSLTSPSKFMAQQLDRQYFRERDLVARFRAIPNAVLIGQYRRLDAYLIVWEKWLDIARIFGLLGTALVLMLKGDALGLPMAVRQYAEIYVSATVIGVLSGALIVRTGIRDLQQILAALKTISAQKEGKRSRSERKATSES